MAPKPLSLQCVFSALAFGPVWFSAELVSTWDAVTSFGQANCILGPSVALERLESGPMSLADPAESLH